MTNETETSFTKLDATALTQLRELAAAAPALPWRKVPVESAWDESISYDVGSSIGGDIATNVYEGNADFISAACSLADAMAAELIGRREAERWRDAEKELPDNHERVLVTVEIESGKRMVDLAYYIRPKTVEATFDDEPQEHDSATDTDWIKPGWYEFSHEAEAHYMISGKVISWRLSPAPKDTQ